VGCAILRPLGDLGNGRVAAAEGLDSAPGRARAENMHRARRDSTRLTVTACEQIRVGLRELHVSAALVLPQPAAFDRKLEAGAIFCRAAFVIIQERTVDQLDEDAAVLDGIDRVCDLHKFLRGSQGIGKGPDVNEFVHASPL